jgi:hypothetical protein
MGYAGRDEGWGRGSGARRLGLRKASSRLRLQTFPPERPRGRRDGRRTLRPAPPRDPASAPPDPRVTTRAISAFYSLPCRVLLMSALSYSRGKGGTLSLRSLKVDLGFAVGPLGPVLTDFVTL